MMPGPIQLRLYVEGERVFVYMPAAKSNTAYKLARPFHGPYRVVHVVDNGVEVRPVDQPHATPTRVALNRVRRCPVEMPDVFWPRKDACHYHRISQLTPRRNQNLWWNQPHSRPSGQATCDRG